MSAGIGLCANAQDIEAVLEPMQDTSIYAGTSGSNTLSDGKGESLWLATTAEGLTRRALIKFDLSAIPPGSVIRQTTLFLYQLRARDEHVVRLHRVLASWGEGASNAGSAGTGAPAQPGDATWLHRFYPGTLWLAAGGDFLPTASASQVVGPPNVRYSWGGEAPAQGANAPPMVKDVQGWVDAPASNHGWILIGVETTLQNAKRFQSRENAVERPRLVVRYQPAPLLAASDGDIPLPGWAVLALGAALAAGLARRKRGLSK